MSDSKLNELSNKCQVVTDSKVVTRLNLKGFLKVVTGLTGVVTGFLLMITGSYLISVTTILTLIVSSIIKGYIHGIYVYVSMAGRLKRVSDRSRDR